MCAGRNDNSTDEIEITPAMVSAGLETLYSFPITEPYEEDMRDAVMAVFKVMYRLRIHIPASE